MKPLLPIAIGILCISTSIAQIPNAGFENWTDGDPDGWNTLDFMWDAVIQSTDAHSGSYAARLEIIDFMGSSMPPFLETVFPASERFASLTGYYKYLPQSDEDVFSIDIILYKGSSVWDAVGSGSLEISTPAQNYTKFTVPIEYWSTDTPDSAWIFFIVDFGSDDETPGSYALLDDLSLSLEPATSVTGGTHLPLDFMLNQNYPNPFNPSTEIAFTIPDESYVELKVYDMLGKEIASLAGDVYLPGHYTKTFTASHLPSGIYIARLNAVSRETNTMLSRSVRMMLVK
jgi:hypothetical protein